MSIISEEKIIEREKKVREKLAKYGRTLEGKNETGFEFEECYSIRQEGDGTIYYNIDLERAEYIADTEDMPLEVANKLVCEVFDLKDVDPDQPEKYHQCKKYESSYLYTIGAFYAEVSTTVFEGVKYYMVSVSPVCSTKSFDFIYEIDTLEHLYEIDGEMEKLEKANVSK